MTNTAEVVFHDQSSTTADAMSSEQEILVGLRAAQKFCSPKFLYDQRGSELFDRICELPEYYPTRTEEAILEHALPEIADLAGEGATLVEFGSGASRKVRLLVEAMSLQQYLGIDISREFLIESTRKLATDYPWLEVHAACADFSREIALPPGIRPSKLVGFFPGSSIGNFTPEDAAGFLKGLHRILPSGSGLLIGVDLIKDRARLEAAYNDAEGVTADFNLNLLSRLGEEFGFRLRPDQFRHRAFYNDTEHRIEMHLVSRVAQMCQHGAETFRFREGETIHTENSYKYTVPGFQRLAFRAGFESRRVWTDDDQLFSVHYLMASPN